MKAKQFGILPSLGVLALLTSGPTWAQEIDETEDIVVTGSSIRGIAPAGMSVIGTNEEAIAATGGANAADVLQELPQAVGYFNALPAAGASFFVNDFAPVPRVTLRNLGNGVQAETALSLILLDGHRVVQAGIDRVGVDINIIPPSLLERVEVITEGGSAVYGTDAIAGVANFITRRSFDGVEFTGHTGTGDGYDTADGTLTVGRDYGSGSIFGSYNYSQHDALFGRDRDYIRDYSSTGAPDFTPRPNPANTQCAEAGIEVIGGGAGRYFGAADFRSLASPLTCYVTEPKAFYPEQYRHTATFGWSQDFSDTVRFDLRAYMTRQTSISYAGPFLGSGRVTPSNPYYRDLGGPNDANSDGIIQHAIDLDGDGIIEPGAGDRPSEYPGAIDRNGDGIVQPNERPAQSVLFDYSPVFGQYSRKQTTELETWQVMPELTWDLPLEWQMRASLSYGETETQYRNPVLNRTAEAAAFAGALFNPYDIRDADPAVLASLLLGVDGEPALSQGVGRNQYSNSRIVFDGPLFTLPGGEVRGAVGAEHARTEFTREKRDTSTGGGEPAATYNQGVNAVFAELQVPIIGENNQLPFVERLFIQGSIRSDDYSDFGRTTNAAFGLTYEPVSWLTFSASKSEAFVAPHALQSAQAGDLTIDIFSDRVVDLPACSRVNAPDCGEFNDRPTLSIAGAFEPLNPTIAESYSFSLEIRPLENLTLRANFARTAMIGVLGGPPGLDVTFEDYYEINQNCGEGDDTPQFYFGSCIDQTLLTRLDAEKTGGDSLAPYLDPDGAGPETPTLPLPQLIIDNRISNFGNQTVENWDFGANYIHPTSWGSWDASASVSLPMLSRSQVSSFAPWTGGNTRDTSTDYRFTASLGADIDNWRVQVRNAVTGGRDITPPAVSIDREDHLDAYIQTDLFVRYDFGEGQAGLTQDLSLTLNVDNVFDREPDQTLIDSNTDGVRQGAFTVGRVVQFGLTKRF